MSLYYTTKDMINDIPILFNRKKIENSINRVVENKFKGTIFTINSNIVVNSFKNSEYHEILKKSLINICDGSILAKSLSIIKNQKLEAYPGPDFFIDMIKEKKFSHAFVGASKEILDELKTQLIEIDYSITNSLFLELPFTDVLNFDYSLISQKINNHNPDFVWVSLGAPKQEIFSSLLVNKLNRGLIVAVGAAFDFYSNSSKVKRAPIYIQTLSLEWLYRLFIQPKKTIKRLKNEFLYMPIILIKELIKARK